MEAVDEFVTPDEAAELLDVTPDRIEVLVEQGLLQAVNVDGKVWFHRAEVEALRLQGG
jgi:excisionase family DNA binding protein